MCFWCISLYLSASVVNFDVSNSLEPPMSWTRVLSIFTDRREAIVPSSGRLCIALRISHGLVQNTCLRPTDKAGIISIKSVSYVICSTNTRYRPTTASTHKGDDVLNTKRSTGERGTLDFDALLPQFFRETLLFGFHSIAVAILCLFPPEL